MPRYMDRENEFVWENTPISKNKLTPLFEIAPKCDVTIAYIFLSLCLVMGGELQDFLFKQTAVTSGK